MGGSNTGGSITRCRSTTTNIGSEEPWPVFAAVTKSMSEEWAVALRSCFGDVRGEILVSPTPK